MKVQHKGGETFTQTRSPQRFSWVPAFAGMSGL